MKKTSLFWAPFLSVSLALPLMTLSFPTKVIAQERIIRTLTVTGQGTEKIPTTLTQVSLGVQIEGKTAQQVQQEVADRSAQVVEFLRSRNVSKLQTTGIRLEPNYDYRNNERRLIGYTATNTVSFEVSTEQAGSIMDQAVKAGATKINGVSFRASESAIEQAQNEALRKATQNAQQQARVVLESLNLTEKDIVSISINGANTPVPPPVFRQSAAMAERGDATTPVIGGEQEVTASVTLQIGY